MKRPPIVLLVLLSLTTLGVGWAAAHATPPTSSSSTVRLTQTVTGKGKVITRVVNGKVITVKGGERVVRVPELVVKYDHRRITVPAHNIRLRRVERAGGLLSSTVAVPTIPVTVTVSVPTTVYVPTTVTSFTTVTIPTTITVPLADPEHGGATDDATP